MVIPAERDTGNRADIMARRKVDVEGALPPSTTTTTTRRMTRSQSHAPGAIPLAEKLTTPKRRAKKSGAATTTTTTSSGSGRKKSSTVATKKKTKTRKDTDDKGVKISPPQDSGFSFGDNGTQTTDTEVTEATEVTETDQTDQTDVDRTDTEVELTDVERSSVQQEEEVEEVDAPGVAAGDEGALAVIEEEREVEEVTETSVTKEAAGDGGGYLFSELMLLLSLLEMKLDGLYLPLNLSYRRCEKSRAISRLILLDNEESLHYILLERSIVEWHLRFRFSQSWC